jgi:hypothetical protein
MADGASLQLGGEFLVINGGGQVVSADRPGAVYLSLGETVESQAESTLHMQCLCNTKTSNLVPAFKATNARRLSAAKRSAAEI